MAGFQQAANALTGAYGTVAGRIGIYSELVGKNKEQREQLEKQNKELATQYEILNGMKSDAELELDAIHQKEWEKKMAKKEREKFKKELEIRKGARAERKLDIQLAHASKNMMINALYGDFASGSGGGI